MNPLESNGEEQTAAQSCSPEPALSSADRSSETERPGKRSLPWGRLAAFRRGVAEGLFRRLPMPGANGNAKGFSQSLHSLSQAIAQQSGRTESDFVQLGECLRGLHTHAGEVTRVVRERADALKKALAESRIGGAEGLASRSLAELKQGLDRTSSLLPSLRIIEVGLRQLHLEVSGIKRIAVLLHAAVFGFAIESARTPECQRSFGSFVEGLRALVENIRARGESMAEHVRTTQISQARGLDMLASGLDELRTLATSLEATSGNAAGHVQQLLDASLAALETAERSAAQIGKRADEAVYYLQFGDITRQKLEHVVAALQQSASLLSGPNGPRESSPDRTAVEGVLSVQTSQLEVIAKELLDARDKLAGRFEGVVQETNHLAEALERCQRSDGEGDKDPMADLRTEVERMAELHRQGCSLRSTTLIKASHTAEAAASLAQRLDEVRDTNEDMHLQALNAIIKTSALGDQGRTLEVLSMQVDRLFRESNQQVAGIIAGLENIRRAADEVGGESGSSNPSSSEASVVERDLHSGLDRVVQAHGQFRQTSTEAMLLAQKQQAFLSLRRTDLDFLGRFAETLNEQIRRLGEIRRELAPASGEDPSARAHAVDFLRDNYTMQSEREIHRRVARGQPPQVPAEAPEKASLQTATTRQAFSTPEALPAQVPPPSADKQEDEKLDPALAAAEADFGDNVELF